MLQFLLNKGVRVILSLAGGGLLLAGLACTAQIRNGDRIAADPHLRFSSETRASEFAELDLDEAREQLESAEGASDWNDRGVLDARLQRVDLAEAAFESAIERDPAYEQAYLNLARLYYLLGETDRARTAYERLAQTQIAAGTNASGLFSLARTMATSERLPEARLAMQALAPADASASTATKPQSYYEASLWLAADAMHRAEYAAARDYYDRVLAANELEKRALFGRGYISYLAEDWDAATHLLSLARQQGSREPALPYALARAYFEQEQYDRALEVARATEQPGLELLALQGRAALILDYRADLEPVLQRARPEDRERLQRLWYGNERLRELPELNSEFKYLY